MNRAEHTARHSFQQTPKSPSSVYGASSAAFYSADRAALRDEVLHTVACKSAIKAGMTSDPAELRALAAQVQSGAVRYCPHGRPVAVKLREYEIEKMFKRA